MKNTNATSTTASNTAPCSFRDQSISCLQHPRIPGKCTSFPFPEIERSGLYWIVYKGACSQTFRIYNSAFNSWQFTQDSRPQSHAEATWGVSMLLVPSVGAIRNKLQHHFVSTPPPHQLASSAPWIDYSIVSFYNLIAFSPIGYSRATTIHMHIKWTALLLSKSVDVDGQHCD